jgi:hypothetical protein
VKDEWKLEWFRNNLCERISNGEFTRHAEPEPEMEGQPF